MHHFSGFGRTVLVLASLVFIVGLALTLVGIHLINSVPPWDTQVVGETLRDAGISVFGGLIVGFVVATVQRHFDAELAARTSEEEARRTIDLTLVTQQTLDGIDLSGVHLENRYLANKSFIHARFGDAFLNNSVLRHSNLSESDLTGADLTGADLREANMRNADLTGATLTSADLQGVTDLSTAIWDESTTWPHGFVIPKP